MLALIVLAGAWVLVAPLLAIVVANRAGARARDLKRDVDVLTGLLDEALFRLRTADKQAAPSKRPAVEPEPVRRPAAAPWSTFAPTLPSDARSTDVEPAAAPTIPEPREPLPTPPAPEASEPVPHASEPMPDAPPAPDSPEPFDLPLPPLAPLPGDRRLQTLEEKIGGRWSVLVGGLALALGAIFLVRYSIEQGLLGPGVRIMLGFLLSAALFCAGEWLRRRDRATDAPVFAQADIPAILTGAGGVAAFATVYAAYALYGFIGEAAAFVLLTVAGLATLALSVIHGPALAGLGALGSYVAPLLVSSAAPRPLPVVLHTLAVTAAVLGMARIRSWRWLAIAGICASLVWGFLTGTIESPSVASAELLLVAGLVATYLAALVAGAETPDLRDRGQNVLALSALSALAVLSLLYIGMSYPAYPPLLSGIVLAGALGAAAARWTSIAAAALLSGALAVATIMLLDAPGAGGFATMRVGAVEWRVLGDAGIGTFALQAAAIGLLVGIGGFLSADRFAAAAPRSAGYFAAAGAGAPLLILIVVYLRHTPFETRPSIGLAALALAAILAAMAERLIPRRPAEISAPAPAYYACGSVLSLSFAAAVGLSPDAIPLALALGAAGVVWVARRRPVFVLPWLAALLAAFACLSLFIYPALSPADIGTTPILNGLILRVGLPAAALLLAGEMRRRTLDDIPANILQTLGLALAALFVVLEIRHIANDGVIVAGPPGLGEQSALTLAALAFSLGLQRIARATQGEIYRGAALVLGVAGAAQIALAHFITVNPLFTGENVGDGVVFNLLLPGYLLPALLAGWVAAAAKGIRPSWYVSLLSGLAAALGFAFVTLTVRHVFHAGELAYGAVLEREVWTYTATWLVFSLALQRIAAWAENHDYDLAGVLVGLLAAALIVVGHFVTSNPVLTGTPVGNAFLFNLLLPAYLLPALLAGCVAAAAKAGRPPWYAPLFGALAAALAFAFVTLTVRHAFHGSRLASGELLDPEIWTYTVAWLLLSLALQRIAVRLRDRIYELASMLVGLLAAALVVVGHFVIANPALTGTPVGESVLLNLLVPGYLIPAGIAAFVAAASRPARPYGYAVLFAALSLALAFAFVILSVRHAFHGTRLDGWTFSDAEHWTYSAVWLAFGIALLVAGIFARSTMVRAASGLVIAAVVCKVFLFDMAALAGALRAASFLGLGAVLIFIGRLYQRLLMRRPAEAGAAR